jgi:hypothetical protein
MDPGSRVHLGPVGALSKEPVLGDREGEVPAHRGRSALPFLQRHEERFHVGPAIVGTLGEAAHHHGLQRGGNRLSRGRRDELRRCIAHVRHERLHRLFVREGRLAREQLVENHPKGVDVRPGVEGLALYLLWRDVLGRAEEDTRLRVVVGVAGGGRHVLGQTEVEDLRGLFAPSVDEHHVARLDVPMHHAQTVRLAKRAAHLLGHVHGTIRGHRALLGEDLLEGLALEQLHRDEEESILGLSVVEDPNGVGVGELGRRGRLEEKAPAELGVARFVAPGREHLECDQPTQRRLLGLVDRTHPTSRDGGDDAETAIEDPPEQGIRGGLGVEVGGQRVPGV